MSVCHAARLSTFSSVCARGIRGQMGADQIWYQHDPEDVLIQNQSPQLWWYRTFCCHISSGRWMMTHHNIFSGGPKQWAFRKGVSPSYGPHNIFYLGSDCATTGLCLPQFFCFHKREKFLDCYPSYIKSKSSFFLWKKISYIK